MMAIVIPGNDSFSTVSDLGIYKRFDQVKTYKFFDNKETGKSYDYIEFYVPAGNTINAQTDVVLEVRGQDLVVAAGGVITGGTVTHYSELMKFGDLSIAVNQVMNFSMTAEKFNQFMRERDPIKERDLRSEMLSGDDVYVNDTSGDDNLRGEGGNDRFNILRGSSSADGDIRTKNGDFISGGSGFDTVVFTSAFRKDATFITSEWKNEVELNVKYIPMLKKTAQDNYVILQSIEKIEFKDGSIILDIPNTSDNAAIYRLYQAALGRAPDETGFRAWVNGHDNGLSVAAMAPMFRESAEFKAKYGVNVSNQEYVTLLYKNVLGRAPDEAGLKGWVDALAAGALSRDNVLLGFSDSGENISLTAQSTAKGYWFPI